MIKFTLIFLIFIIINTCFGLYSDIPYEHWAKGYINDLLEIGVLSDSKTFRGTSPITRYEVATIVGKYNKYIENKLSFYMANAGETKPSNYESPRATYEEYDDALKTLRDDVKYLASKYVLSNSNKDKLSINSKTTVFVSSKIKDMLFTDTKISYEKQFYDSTLFLSLAYEDLLDENNNSFLEISLKGKHNLPVIGNIEYCLEKGSGDKLNSNGEAVSMLQNKVSLAYQPLEIGLFFVTQDNYVLYSNLSQSLQIQNNKIQAGWTKKYRYSKHFYNIIREGYIVDNKDTFFLKLSNSNYYLHNLYSFGGQNHFSYVVQAGAYSILGVDVFADWKASGENGFDALMADNYLDSALTDIFNKPLENGANTLSFGFKGFLKLFYGTVEKKTYNSSPYYKANLGFNYELNSNLVIQPEMRALVSDTYKELQSLIIINLKI